MFKKNISSIYNHNFFFFFQKFYRTSTSFRENLNPEDIFKDLKKIPNMLRSRLVVEHLSTNDCAELLTSVLHSDATAIADCIFKIPALKLALQ